VSSAGRTKIAIVVSSPMTVRAFLLHQIQALSAVYDVTIVANFDGLENPKEWLPDGVKWVHIPVARKPNLRADFKALCGLISLFRTQRFSLVHSVTPKAGLLAMTGSRLARVPVRIHTFTGQVWATKTGMARVFLRLLDTLTDRFATQTLVDSRSQLDFLKTNRVVSEAGSSVLGDGSVSGVDTSRFKSDDLARREVRDDLGIPESMVLLLFLGRLKKEKGVVELMEAFNKLHGLNKNTALCLVGPDEENLSGVFEKNEGVHIIPFTTTPERYFAAADIFCLPSHREGFGTVVIEAASCGIPTIGSNIYGLRDAIIQDTTGLLVSVRSVDELGNAMRRLTENAPLCAKMGKAAQTHAHQNFSQERITGELLKRYSTLLK
jgi:glycosyltransferase involved in cell wall biosynthesis